MFPLFQGRGGKRFSTFANLYKSLNLVQGVQYNHCSCSQGDSGLITITKSPRTSERSFTRLDEAGVLERQCSLIVICLQKVVKKGLLQFFLSDYVEHFKLDPNLSLLNRQFDKK